MNTSCGLIWFREDLRVKDNTALVCARKAHEQILALYFIDPSMWRAHDVAACRVEFILRNLACLNESLAKKNITLLVLEIQDTQQIVPLMQSIVLEYGISAVYFNDQYELNENRRDAKVKAGLMVPVYHFTDQIIFPPQQLLTHKHTPYTIFTPYKRRFIQAVYESVGIETLADIKACSKKISVRVLSDHWLKQGVILHTCMPKKIAGFSSPVSVHLWPAGEQYAEKQLHQFVQTKMPHYAAQRDFPGLDGTSKLSPYLAAGVLSSRQCFSAAIAANKGVLQSGRAGIDTWISELIWREFYKQIVAHFPHVSMNNAFKRETDQWPWRHDKKILTRWKAGETGYPLIDAAMRQLLQTGYMHNRLRMVVAMFLTKDCFIDWRLGEQFFMQHLIDGDFAANNGGWQWAASTGCDAVPYFRVFNPVRQSMRFDPQGMFIKKYCPELAEVPIKQLHDPFTLPPETYFKPIVDYRHTRTFLRDLFH